MLFRSRRTALETIAKALLEFETLDGSQIRDIVDHGEMKNPPAAPTKPPSAEPPPLASQGDRPRSGALDFPPGLTEQPA